MVFNLPAYVLFNMNCLHYLENANKNMKEKNHLGAFKTYQHQGSPYSF